MSTLLPPPPHSPFDDKGQPSRVWVEWMERLYRVSKKYRGADTTANRPTNALEVGDWYFDTTLGKPILYKSPGWVDASGLAA